MIRVVFVILLLALGTPALAQQPLPNHHEAGPHGVGFRALAQYDTSRNYAPALAPAGRQQSGAAGRPIQTAIWYPAKKGGRPMRYDDYLQLVGWEDHFERSDRERSAVLDEWLARVTGKAREAQVTVERGDLLRAVRDAQALPGRFPVVVYSPSLSSPAFENAEMMELLASHGYIVIASPALGVDQRVQRLDVAHAEAQAADIRFLVDFAHTLPEADAGRLAVAGFSFGGIANVIAAARDPRIKALVCLDGTMRYHPAMLAGLPDVNLGQLRTPLLYLAQRPVPHERLVRRKPDLSGSTLHALKRADVYLLTMQAMEHVHFATSFLRLDPLEFDEFSRDEVARAHGASGRYVLNFLNGVLKDDEQGLAYLMKKPEQLGMPRHSVRSELIAAQP